ncbi:Putative transport protein YhhT [Nocardioides aquaticus]|uniref:Transport protein YhhT n=2 Tax=Actinomycetes TaxID=1760 RepID=A0ABX8ED58_9ACTN|nr:AI-2E family transporter [Nocardioides aquaticus]QVT77825.1 Putative transport protein YhhT [Nocardioides aquaticus]
MSQTRTNSLLVSGACVVIVVAGLRSASDIVGPVVLAVALTIVFHPLRARLERRMPTWAASVVLLLLAYLLILALTLALVVSVGRLAALVPAYAADLDDLVADVTGRLSSAGVAPTEVAAAAGSLDVGRVLDVATSFMAGIAAVLSDLFFIVTLLLFLAFDAARVSWLADRARVHRPELVDALATFARGTRSYLGVSAVFGLIVAVIDTAMLWAIGVPGAFVWGVLAFVTNFIPNIGFVIGVVPPALIGLLEGGPSLMLWVVVLYSVVNLVIQSIIQPRYVGSAVGLSTTLTFLSLVFWAWVLGPLGALLAVPMSLLVRAVLVDADPEGHWKLPLISGQPSDQAPAATP